MVQLTTHDSAVLTRLVQFSRLPIEKRRQILNELKSEEARRVGEAVLDPQKYSESATEVRETVDRFTQWSQANRRITRHRTARRQATRSR